MTARQPYEEAYDGSYAGDAGSGYVEPVGPATYATAISPTFSGTVTLSAGCNFVFDTATGSQIGTGSTQKIGFWGATPAVRPAALTAATAAVTATAGAAYTAAEQTMLNDLKTLTTNLRTRINELESRNQTIGILS